MESKIKELAWIKMEDLGETEKMMFLDHYKNNENVYILTTIDNRQVNIEYKITSIKNNIINLEFANNIII